MIEPGFVKADSTNLPNIDVFMVAEFVKNDDRYNAAEIRLVKASLSSRESYEDSAIDYVCLRRESSICTIKGKICPEHRVKSKRYAVTLVVNEADESIEEVNCEDCAASQGGCKHALAFLMWLHRKSEQRSPTEVECYWNKPILGTVGTTKKFVEATELCKQEIPSTVLPDNSTFLQNILKKAEEKQIDSQLSRHNFEVLERECYSLSLHHLLIAFLMNGGSAANDFIRFAMSKMTAQLISKTEVETRQQSESSLWYELRYGRITASVMHEAAHCKTADGSFTNKILGAAKKFDSALTRRGKNVEKTVISEVEKLINKRLKKCGIILIPQCPMLGASPDAMGEDFVVEVKCPGSDKTFSQYIANNEITSKYKAQIQIQNLKEAEK
ncbi:uncharacterized protein LOC114882098 [Osmia bicornis bicornis]|uniref:uncharacterized protein LOC114882098 n=1 Tax=Osmia bicornis bicornis TaxID=1437191 RepID=UPI001EAEB046|nr:uncharacterized protein LOC114882098 [Osmia bicornis bicornis]